MRARILLAAILLSLSFCFMPGPGYAKVKESLLAPVVARQLELRLLLAQVNYMRPLKNSSILRLYSQIEIFGQIIRR